MSSDPRADYLAQTAAAVLGSPNLAQGIAQAPEVATFLNELNVTVLQVISDGSKFRCFANKVANVPPGALEVHFVKLAGGSEELVAGQIQHQVMTSSMRNSAVQALHTYLQGVYGPVLFGDAKSNTDKKTDNQLRDLLYSLQAGLQRSLRKGGNSLRQVDFQEEEFRGIISPLDEIECWQEIERENVGNQQNEQLLRKAETINRHFQKISSSLTELDNLDLGQVSALVDNTQDCLDGIWRDQEIHPPYQQPRMEHFFKVTTKALGARIEKEFKENDIWQSSFSEVRVKLNECMRICRGWKDRTTELTREFWKGQDERHKWDGKPFYDSYLENIIIRISVIFELRSQHDELLRLLTQDERERLKVNSTFDPFRRINSFYTNEFQTTAWQRSMKEYESIMEPMEREICTKLRTQYFSNAKASASQQLREFQRWKGLLSKESIKREMQQDRETLLQLLINEVSKFREEFNMRTGQSLDAIPGQEKPPQSSNVSETVSAIIWSRQLMLKIQNNLKVSKGLLADLSGMMNLESASNEIMRAIKDFENNLFSSWVDGIKRQMQDQNQKQKFEMSGQLMEFDYEAGGLLKVNYSPKLVTLVKDARVLGEHGFKIPKAIHTITENAKKFYKEGLTLKQAANFFNSMGTQMIDCQKPMMIDKVTQFEHLIKNPKGNGGVNQGMVTWNDPIEIQQYNKKVQAQTVALIAENRKLGNVHRSAVEMINELMNINLLNNRELWRTNLQKIRKIIESVTKQRQPEYCKLWLTHLNYQLYKALEHQYQMGLESLNESLPEVQASLVYRNQTIELIPTFETLKENYFREISSFITTPLKFMGVGGQGTKSEMYKFMPEMNSKHIKTVYNKAEDLFGKLELLTGEYIHWTALGSLDLHEHIEKYFTGVKDWVDNLEMLKQKRRELKKLPDQKKVDCITVNMVPFKSGIDSLFRSFEDALTETLEDSIEKDTEVVRKFVQKGLEQLNANPQSVEEIEVMHTNAVQLGVEKEGIVRIYEGCEKKNMMIKQMKGTAMNLSEIESMWKYFDARLATFQDKIQEQKGRLVQELDNRVKTLNSDLEKMYDKWNEKKPKDRNQLTYEEAQETSEMMKELRQQWQELQSRIAKTNRDCEHFAKDKPTFTFYDKMKDELEMQNESWAMFEEFKNELDEMGKEEWLTYRKKGYFSFQDFFLQWTDKIKAAQNKTVVTRFLQQQIEEYKMAWPLMKLCTGESFEKEHWRKLITMLGMPKEVTFDNMKFSHLIDAVPTMVKKSKDIKDLSDKAQGEVTIREAINELRIWCDSTDFTISDYLSNNRTTPLIKEWKEVITAVSDHQSLIMSLKESRYFQSFADSIEQFEKRFGGIDDHLAKLNTIQRKWVYLEPIFMRGALPSEQGRFRRVDEEYRSIALGIGTDPKVMSLVEIPGLKDTLETILTQLEMCQKALNDYLEEKRQKFSRFYFIGDDDLLEILGQASNPEVIQNHLKKLFSGIFKVAFNKENTQIKSMISSASEYVELAEPIQIEGEVENWLNKLEEVMRTTLNNLLQQCQTSGGGLDIANMPSQVCCLSEMVNFGRNCVNAIKQGKLQNYKGDLQRQLESYAAFDNGGNDLIFVKVKALILDIIHNIDVVDQLLVDNITQTCQPNDWMWYKQLRYQIDPRSQQCLVGMCDAFFDYTFEYQGNASKLVHTPLSDKCFLTLVMGMKLGYGGNPYGPAGTGKTESVKALGQNFGRQVLVFNCDEGLDYKSMGRIFIGLVKCGAWGCFDEFNRLLEVQLSAISQQIQIIQYAIKEGLQQMTLLGRNIVVNKNAGIFVTMNPAGKGYGGRSKLPDNLKQLFRPVAMSAPDIELIAEVTLFSEGFKEAKKLSTKVVSLFKLCGQLLTPQQHYDWKLRAQKTILGTGGQLMQQELKKGRKLRYEDEALILIKAIRVNTMSKLTYNDAIKYEALQADMFPGINSADIEYESLTEAVNATIAELKLQHIDTQVRKIQQFYEATKQRMGVVIVGPSGCGKTTIWKTLKLAYEKMGVNVVTSVMNPKSMPREQLLGLMNHDTREFQDGVLTSSARQAVKEPNETICWIICDGDIDPEWVESLNSVLDDNRLLTLPNGERIAFGSNVNFIFETNDMKYASPATVTRLGMIFLSEEDVDVGRVTKTWLKKQPEDMQNKIEGWMADIFMPALDWVLQRQKHLVIETTKVGIVNNALSYLNDCSSKSHFAYGCILGLGSNFKYELRKEFMTTVMSQAGERGSDPNILLNFFDPQKQSWGAFVQESATLEFKDFTNPEAPPMILTPAIQKDIAVIKPLLERNENFVLCGPEGCGKNLIITSLIKQMKSTQMAVIHCNAQTSASSVISKLNTMCAQSTNSQGRVYRPKECQRLIVYLKDINLPRPDKYDTIQLISFLQQIVCYQGFYDTNLDFVQMERITIVASMNPSTTIGRHRISSRFTANVRLAYMDYSSQEELLPVYNLYLKTILSHERLGGGKLAGSTRRLASFLIDMYGEIRQKFSVDDHRHYLFTPRMVTQLIFQLLRYEIPDAGPLIATLVYESQRVYRDRLVDRQSKKSFDQVLFKHVQTDLKFPVNKLEEVYFLSKITQGQESAIPGIPNMGRIPKADFIQMIEQAMRAYEREFKELDIHLIEEVLDLIAYIERGLSMPGGCMLLAGRSGVGRKQSTQLVCHLLNIEFFTPNINREYGMKEFKRDLKQVCLSTGINAEKTCLYVEDHQLLSDEFLTLINSLLSSGEVPGLYTPEELEPLLAQLQDEMRNQYECRTLFEFFVSRVKKYLSIVISLDNKHPNFTQNCSQNPSLFNKCLVIWNDGWSKESLKKVSEAMLDPVMNILDKNAESMINGAQYLFSHIGDSFTVSPQSFVNFIGCYRQVLEKISSASGGQTKHLIAGLEKLQEAQVTVDKLSREAGGKKKVLAAAQKEANAAMQKISVSMEQKAARKTEVETLQAHCANDEKVISERKIMVEGELSGIQPEVDAARASVGELKSSNLNEIKGFRVPPDAVVHVLGAVMQFLGQTDISWNAMKRFLSNAGVINQIVNYDARGVTPGLRKKVDKIINENPASFEYASIYNVSRATAPLASWVKANVKYSEVLLKIEPLTSELNKLLAKLHQSQERVEQCQVQLAQLSEQTEQLNNDFQQKTMEAARLEADLKAAQDTLTSAQSLLGQLTGENDRWKIQVKNLELEMSLVPLRSLVSSGYITYMGSQDETVREKTLREWLSALNMQDNYNFRSFLSTETQMLTWKKEGLPADSLSVENAIMITTTQKTPLIIDPATQASEWLKVMLKKNSENVEVLNAQDSKFNTNIELAIRFGKTLIIQEVDGIESMLVPILRKDLIQQGPRQVVQIGEKSVDYNPAFRLFMTTRDQFVRLPPNISDLVSSINFTVTKSGLEGQLLGITINFEQPELEARKTQLLEEEERLKIQLSEFEKKLLESLGASTGNILENKPLIATLEQTKQQSSQIEKALNESGQLQVSLDQQREVYRDFSVTGSNLFMVFGDLLKMNNMYQFSLASFIKLFNRSLDSKPQAASTEQKLQKLSNTLIKLAYSEIGRSLFKADRLTYSLHFVKGVFSNLFGPNEWEFFNGNSSASTESNVRMPNWVAPDRKELFGMFCNSFGPLANQLGLDNANMWGNFAESEQAELEFPEQLQQRVSAFQKLMVIQVTRPDRLESAMDQFVKEAFGGQAVQPTSFNLQRLYESESSATEPVLFIISPGSDPSQELQTYADQVVGRAAYHELAMGGGNNEVAIETVKQAAEKGEWVCLKNLHLVTPWLSILEKEFKMLTPNPRFRLWLTSEPHVKFPSILLQSSLKITYETPPGMKNNLVRTFQYVAPQNGSQEPNKMQLLFVLSWFHSMIQERRKFIPQGWTKFYEFSYGDLKAGDLILSGILKEGQGRSIAWQKVYGILENAIYGGRVDNEFDMRVLRSYMREVFKDQTLKGQAALSNIANTPQANDVRSFLSLISQLPDSDQPVMFGLPSNIDRSVQRFNSTQVIIGLKSLQAVSAEELRFDKEKWTEQLGPLLQLWQNVFRVEVFKSVRVGREELRAPDPVDQFVYMEMVSVKKILVFVNESITSLIKVLQGTEMLTPKIQTEATALLKNSVPESWEKLWEGPENPSSWIRVLCKKGVQLVQWVQRVQQKQLLNQTICLADLLHPETFLNAFRQKSARINNVAIDELKLVSSFEQGKIQANGSIQVESLFLQGCAFDGVKLNEIRGKASEVIQLPIASLAWIQDSQQDPYPEQSVVETPMYFNLDREKLLCTLKMASNGSADRFIISGVALFLNGSD